LNVALLTLTRGNVSGGYRKYLDRLVPLLRAQPEVGRIDLFAPPQMVGPGVHTWSPNDEMFGFRELRRSVAALRPDVVFIPTGRVLRIDRLPVVTMIQNMEPLEVPFGGNSVAESAKNLARAAAARYAVIRSDRVIAISRHVRDFLVDRWLVADEKVGVVPHGIDSAAAEELPIPVGLEGIAGTPFLFTAGSIRPARGLEDVIRALATLPAEVRLVIAGSADRAGEHYGRAMRSLAHHLGIESRVVWAGQLDRPSMSWCFRNAALFVMTSRAEACPNIVLEAMAEGAAAISTDHAPMPEFFADAALYYRERDAGHLAARLAGVLSSPESLRLALRQRGRERAAAFTWEDTARGTVSELQRAIH
jgi:glycosyltransferase involved in cell wall biosynthesis